MTPRPYQLIEELRVIVTFNRELHPVGTQPMQVPMDLAVNLLTYIRDLEKSSEEYRLMALAHHSTDNVDEWGKECELCKKALTQ